MTTALLRQALEALETCETGGYRDVDGDWCPRSYFDVEAVKKAIAALQAAIAQPEQPNEADELLTALDLDPDAYRTDGGWLNIPKIKAAIASPADYPHLVATYDSLINSVKNQPALQPLTAKTLSDAFQVFASGFDTFGNEWQDMGADEYFKAGFKAAHNIKAEKD